MRVQAGFTLLELLIGTAIITASGVGITTLATAVSRSSNEATAKLAIEDFKLKLQSNLENPEAWSHTVAGNAAGSMQCLANHTDCRSSSGQTQNRTFAVYDASGQIFYDSRSSRAGFTPEGLPCSEFSMNSATCPLRYSLEWQSICPSTGACETPMVSISARLEIARTWKSLERLSNRSFNLLRGFATNTVPRSCRALGGRYNAAAKVCERDSFNQTCASGQMLSGLNPFGSPICRPLFHGQCGAGEIVVGYSADKGETICRAPAAQVPEMQSDESRVPCRFFEKAEGAVWTVAAGERVKNELCDASSKLTRNRTYTLQTEMTCKDGYIIPTGRFTETPTTRVLGSCVETACPASVKLGDLYWVDGGTTTETFNCYEADTATKYGVQSTVSNQFQCTHLGEQSTGRSIKTQTHRDTCPDVMLAYDRTFKIESGLQKAKGKILFVVDNSSSMANAQGSLTAGIDTFLDDLTGIDLDVKVINTSWTDNPNTSLFQSLTTYEDMSGKALSGYKDVPAGENFRRIETIRMKGTNRYQLSRSATSSEEATFKGQVRKSIQFGGGSSLTQATAGSSNEAGLCTALAAMYDDGPNKFFEEGDVGGLVFLTDDNDASVWNNSVNSCRNFAVRTNSWQGTVQYRFHVYRYRIQYLSRNIVDGVDLGVQTVSETKVVRSTEPTPVANSVCSPAVTKMMADSARKAESDLITLWNGGKCIVETAVVNMAHDPHSEDRCSTPFVLGGVTYNDIQDWYTKKNGAMTRATQGASSSCTRTNLASEKVGPNPEYGFRGLQQPKALYTDSISKAVYNRGRELFGPRGFYLSNIVNDGTCSFNSGQVKSQKYLDLAALFNGNGNARNYPVCSSNYAGALKPLAQGLRDAVTNSVQFKLLAGEEIKSVEVVRSGQVLHLQPSQYVAHKSRIDFTGFQLLFGDIIRVRVEAVLKDPHGNQVASASGSTPTGI